QSATQIPTRPHLHCRQEKNDQASVPLAPGPVMESTSGPPDFGPTLPFKHDPVGGRVAHENLRYLDVARKFAEHPSAWSFRLYRAVFGPGTDERFAKAVARLREWVQWSVRNSRYIRWV